MNADLASPEFPNTNSPVSHAPNGAGEVLERNDSPQNFVEAGLTELEKLEIERQDLEKVIRANERIIVTRRQGLVILFLISGAVLLVLNEALFTMLANAFQLRSDPLALFSSLPAGMRFLVVWFYSGICIYTIGLLIELPVKKRRNELAELDERYSLVRKSSDNGHLKYQREKIQRLTHQVARVFLDNKDGSLQAEKMCEQANRILAEIPDPTINSWDGVTRFKISQADSLVSQIYEVILREEKELRQQRNWQWIAVGIMLLYIVSLVSVILMFPEAARSDQTLPLFGIPLSVVMWGALGSLGAILYRFYEKKDRVRFDVEVRWLIARPIIGIIMGGLAYLAIATGLLLLNRPTDNTASFAATGTPGRLEAYWIFAFLAGFSDKFYRRIINLLVDKTVGEDEPDKDESSDNHPPPASGETIIGVYHQTQAQQPPLDD